MSTNLQLEVDGNLELIYKGYVPSFQYLRIIQCGVLFKKILALLFFTRYQ